MCTSVQIRCEPNKYFKFQFKMRLKQVVFVSVVIFRFRFFYYYIKIHTIQQLINNDVFYGMLLHPNDTIYDNIIPIYIDDLSSRYYIVIYKALLLHLYLTFYTIYYYCYIIQKNDYLWMPFSHHLDVSRYFAAPNIKK